MKSAALALSLVAAGLAVAGCQQQAAEPAPEESEAAPEAPAGISVTNARLVLPAVKGNPGVVYFNVLNNGDADTEIAAVSVEGAESAMLHMTVEKAGVTSMEALPTLAVPKGVTVMFDPGGNHVMAMGLPDTLEPGGSVEVTLTFSSGDKVSFPAEVRAAGDAG